MPKSTLTRALLVETTARQMGLRKQLCADLLETLLDVAMKGLAEGQSLKISSFGTFTVCQKNERLGRNPKTGVEAPICARKVVSFKASHRLKSRIETKAYRLLPKKYHYIDLNSSCVYKTSQVNIYFGKRIHGF